MTRHGTPSGYRRHQRDGERPCDACVAARREYDARHRATPERVRISRLRARAQIRAYGELAHRYPDEYRELYVKFRDELLGGEAS